MDSHIHTYVYMYACVCIYIRERHQNRGYQRLVVAGNRVKMRHISVTNTKHSHEGLADRLDCIWKTDIDVRYFIISETKETKIYGFYVCVCVLMCMPSSAHICIYTCIHRYIRTYIHKYIHRYILTCSHIQTLWERLRET